MKKVFGLLLAALLVLTGCSSQKTADNNHLKIVTTIFPEYDWVKRLTKGNEEVDVSFLLDSGVDLHSYQPSAKDMLAIADCDVFIYVGGESDRWVKDALEDSGHKNRIVINLLEALGDRAKEEEEVEGMEVHEEEEEAAYDEHIWLSLKNASYLCEVITDQLVLSDKQNAALYQDNLADYQKELKDLDQQYTQVIKKAKYHTLLFGDRFPFRYLVDDYHLDYYAAFNGCSAETEASFETITFLAHKLDELKLPAVMTIDGSDTRIAETIIQNTKQKDQKVLQLHSMQSVHGEDLKNKVDYLSIMKDNLDVLKQALN